METFNEKWWQSIGEKISGLGIENTAELEKAWLNGTKQKISISITVSDEQPPKVKIQMKSTLSKIDVETEL